MKRVIFQKVHFNVQIGNFQQGRVYAFAYSHTFVLEINILIFFNDLLI